MEERVLFFGLLDGWGLVGVGLEEGLGFWEFEFSGWKVKLLILPLFLIL